MTETIQAGDKVAWLRDGGRKFRALQGVVEEVKTQWAWVVVTGVESKHDRKELGQRWAVQLSELVRDS